MLFAKMDSWSKPTPYLCCVASLLPPLLILIMTTSGMAFQNIDAMIEGTSEDMTVVDAASLRRQIIKLNRHLQLLEEENKEWAKRKMVMYSITVAFWLLNSWLWFHR